MSFLSLFNLCQILISLDRGTYLLYNSPIYVGNLN